MLPYFTRSGWLEALKRTYGYEPVVFTTSPPETELREWTYRSAESRPGLPAAGSCRFRFSDHCAPLVRNSAQLTCLLNSLQSELENGELELHRNPG